MKRPTNEQPGMVGGTTGGPPPGGLPIDLIGAVRRCGGDEGFLAALRAIYARADAAAAAERAVCLGGGACCRFDLMGHRLYVSAGELAMLTASAPPAGRPRGDRRCPYQVGPRCAARDRRPLGCRIFFCGPNWNDWGPGSYEKFHREVRLLHQRHCLPYAYVELLAALAQLFARP